MQYAKKRQDASVFFVDCDIKMNIKVPSVYKPLYTEDTRYYFCKGSRSSGKSWAIADRILFELLQKPNLNILCLREIQRSIKHSSKKLLEDRIDFHGLHGHFRILETEIRCIHGRGIIIFNGLQNHTVASLKSMEGIDIVWIEEAMTITAHSLEILIPTIRADGSKMFMSWNPSRQDDPIEQLETETPMENKTCIFSTYLDNPFCPSSIQEEAKEMKRRRPKKYNHIYLGQFGQAEGVIFENIKVMALKESDYKGLECLQGMDFGYANDPTSFVQCYINKTDKIFYIVNGFYKKGYLMKR